MPVPAWSSESPSSWDLHLLSKTPIVVDARNIKFVILTILEGTDQGTRHIDIMQPSPAGPVHLPKLNCPHEALATSLTSSPNFMSVDPTPLGPPGSSRLYSICPPVPAHLSHRCVLRSIHSIAGAGISFLLGLSDGPWCGRNTSYPFFCRRTLGMLPCSAVATVRWTQMCNHLFDPLLSVLGARTQRWSCWILW